MSGVEIDTRRMRKGEVKSRLEKGNKSLQIANSSFRDLEDEPD